MKVARWLMLVAFTVAILGCNKPATPDKNAKGPNPPDNKDNKGDKGDNKGNKGNKEDDKTKNTGKEKIIPDPVPTAAGPKEALQQIVDGIANKKPQVIWTSLPDKYQKDVKGVMTSFASKMDAEVYNKSFATLRKGVDVLKKQKKNIMEIAKDFAPVPPEELNKSYDQTVDVLSALLSSELSNLDELKKADVHAMLAGSGGKIIGQILAAAETAPGAPPLSKLRDDLKIEVLKSEGDQATVKLTSGENSHTMEMVKVDGKWLSKKMVDQWPMAIEKINEGINQINPDNIKQFKPSILKVLSVTDGELDKLAAATSSQDLQKRAGEAMAAIMAALPMPQ